MPTKTPRSRLDTADLCRGDGFTSGGSKPGLGIGIECSSRCRDEVKWTRLQLSLDLDAEGGAVRNRQGQWTMTRREWTSLWCLAVRCRGRSSEWGDVTGASPLSTAPSDPALPPADATAALWGRGNGRGQPSVGKAREVPDKKMVMGKEASCANLCKLQKYREALFSRFRPTTKTTKATKKTPLYIALQCSR